MIVTDGVQEFKVEYYNEHSEQDECYISFDELVTDIRNGELVLWERSQAC